MGDVATTLLVLGPAIITGIVGYAGARLQFRTAIEQIEAENDRFRAQHDERERRHRQQSYHEFLSLMYRLDSMMVGFGELSKRAFERWLDDYRMLHGGIELYGSAQVRRQIKAVDGAIESIGLAARRANAGAFEQQFAEAYRERRPKVVEAVGHVVGEMRKDVQ